MYDLETSFKLYLNSLGLTGPVALDESSEAREEDSNAFKQNLQVLQRSRRRSITLTMILLVVFYVVAVVFVFLFRSDTRVIGMALLIPFLVGTFSVRLLRRFWLEETIILQATHVLETMRPKQAADYLFDLYTMLFGKAGEKGILR